MIKEAIIVLYSLHFTGEREGTGSTIKWGGGGGGGGGQEKRMMVECTLAQC